jgi:uncharacterized protein (DUF362 family)
MTTKKTATSLSRRAFLIQACRLGGGLLALPIIQACQRMGLLESTAVPSATRQAPQPATSESTATQVPKPSASPPPSATPPPESAPLTLTPTPTPLPEGAVVALVKTDDRAGGVGRAINLLGSNPFEGKRVFVKPNFNSGDPAPASTHRSVLKTTLVKLKAMNAGAITVGDRAGMGSASAIMRDIGGLELADQLGFSFMDFTDLGTEDWVMVDPPGNHWTIAGSPLGSGFPFAGPVLGAQAVVSLCCMKTHRYGGVTMSLKNSVGMVADRPGNASTRYMRHLHSGDMDAMIAEINLAYQPALIVMDGVEAFVSGGPASGERVSPGVILAGTDRVAMDALGMAILKMQGGVLPAISGAFHLKNAIQLGIGVGSPEKIHLLTDDPDSAQFAGELHAYLTDHWA